MSNHEHGEGLDPWAQDAKWISSDDFDRDQEKDQKALEDLGVVTPAPPAAETPAPPPAAPPA